MRVFLSSSTLGGVCFLKDWERLGEHADFETVAGGTLSILKRVWEQSYHSLNIATDTLLVRSFYISLGVFICSLLGEWFE